MHQPVIPKPQTMNLNHMHTTMHQPVIPKPQTMNHIHTTIHHEPHSYHHGPLMPSRSPL